MNDPANDPTTLVTQLLQRLEAGDGQAANDLFPLVYNELRQLAKRKLLDEKIGHTLQPTALVNEAYIRLVGKDSNICYRSRGGFFVAASHAMRHILVDSARRKLAQRRGGVIKREYLDLDAVQVKRLHELVQVHEALEALALADPKDAEIVQLHYFGGHSLSEIAQLQGCSRATVNRRWIYARAWLKTHIESDQEAAKPPTKSDFSS